MQKQQQQQQEVQQQVSIEQPIGPVEIDAGLLHLVSGGAPRNTWSEQGGTSSQAPRNTW